MRLTILGNNGPFPAAGGACSGYLVQNNGTNILLECGNGVLSNLQRYIKLEDLDAVIVSHLHSDHVSDLMVLRYAIQIKRKRGVYNKLLDVFAPQEPLDEYERLDIKDAFSLKTINTSLVLSLGSLEIMFEEMKHPVKSFAISVESEGRRFVYSGDTCLNDRIANFAQGCDLLMLDAGLLSRDKTDENVPHLTAGECGAIACEAGAKRLLLTHFQPQYHVEEIVAEARMNFKAAEAAQLLSTYEI